ncbi:CBS domain-containing protein [Acuticoccus sp. M5D2P5]|uniref:CBS domain-containing protein n=1 Tax=Acuticoccus kalidii TaxID=2910977 RepID=UPI001F3A8B4A|nr:CBS domain-containing protein [Acuticoccus kalidii]MCF3935652.1 CBS domain-containing protein [Acuticoccus kalidii]
MSVKTILRGKGGDIFSMASDATLQMVVAELAKRKVGALLIIDGERLAGIVSERDVVRVIARDGPSALTSPVSAAMTQKVETCGLDEPIHDVMSRMTASRFRHMPVVEEDRLVGVISIGDVVKERIEEAERERDEMQAYIHSV